MVQIVAPRQSFDELTETLSQKQKKALRNGRAVVTTRGDRFVGQVIANVAPDVVWEVITDYQNFAQFLPSIVSSTVLESQGDRTVVEQVGSRRVLLMDIKSRLRTENIETAKQRIDFRLLEGDLKVFEGHWQLYSLENPVDASTDPMEQTLIVQLTKAKAGIGLLEGSFSDAFKDSVQENLTAVCAEVERRGQA
ncbi:MAG: SRPBCC family protein [Synechococcales bacterium]|nr:SRPBCC family protein [Synechococcales bacterium]